SFRKLTPKTIGDPATFENHLRTAAQKGFAVDLGEETPDIRCVASPILDYRGRPVAAVWITGPASRFGNRQIQDFAVKVSETARRISGRIGFAGNKGL